MGVCHSTHATTKSDPSLLGARVRDSREPRSAGLLYPREPPVFPLTRESWRSVMSVIVGRVDGAWKSNFRPSLTQADICRHSEFEHDKIAGKARTESRQ